MRVPGRIGVGRAWIVIGCVVAVVGVGLAKPWEQPSVPSVAVAQALASDDTSAVAATPDATIEPASTPEPSPPSPPTQGRPVPPDGLYLELAVGQLGAVTATSETGWLVAQWHPDPVEIRFASALPRSAAFGSTCSGGFLLNEGTNEFALALPAGNTAPSVQTTLWRLFAKGAPVSVPTSVEMAGQTGIVLVKSSETRWVPGDYALTIEQGGEARSFLFCIGRSFRMVDYKLLTLVPPGVDSRAARSRLLEK